MSRISPLARREEATLSALITELSAAGIVFTETGVEFV
jgi:hypothetical protein